MRKRKNILRIVFVVILTGIFVSSFLISLPFFHTYVISILASEEVFNRVLQEVSNGTQREVVINILEWEKAKMLNTYKTPLNYFCKFWYDLNPKSVFITRCGSCGEFAYVFIEMAKNKELEVREIENCGRDHAWAEIFLDNQWVPVETTAGKDGLNALHFYDCNWTSILAHVFTINNSQKIDLTSKYICEKDLSKIMFYHEPNSKILISMPECKNYQEVTNSSGVLEIKLGKGNYTINAEKDFFFTSSFTLEVKGNETIERKIRLKFDWLRLIMILLLVILVCEVTILIPRIRRKLNRKRPLTLSLSLKSD